MSEKRGYFLVGIEKPKITNNTGSLFRSAYSFGASGLFLIQRKEGSKTIKQASDTPKSWRHIPLHRYKTSEDFINFGIPYSCQLVGIEINSKSRSLNHFVHPQRAVYVVGSEDNGLSNTIIKKCNYIIQLPGTMCLNVAVAGSIVLCDRILKEQKNDITIDSL